MGRYFVILKAGNHQEIARSCPFSTEAAAGMLYPTARIRAAYLKKSEADSVVDTTDATRAEYVEKSEANSVVDTTDATRAEYVEKSEADSVADTTDATRAEYVEKSEADSVADTTDATRAEYVEKSEAGSVADTTDATRAEYLKKSEVEASPDVEDDYLPCREYEGRNINDKVNNVALFKHDNGQYYFAIYDTAGSVRLRSEGFRSAQERDIELSGVMKNLNNQAMYSVIRRGDYFINVLKDKTGREVGRSCLQKDVPAPAPVVETIAPVAAAAVAAAIVAPTVETPAPVVETIAPVAIAAVAAAVVAPTVSVVAPSDVEDDYLPCKDYEGHNINDKANNVALFKHSNGQYYFALYDADGKVRLRSEGFRTAQDRDKELSGALKNLYNTDMYTTIRRGEYYLSVLKDKTGREVGRSCLQKDEPKPVVAPIIAPVAIAAVAAAAAAISIPDVPKVKVEVPKVEVPVVKKVVEKVVPPPVFQAATPVVEEAAAGMAFWKWLIPLLLLGALIWWFTKDGCAKPEAVTPAVTTVPVPTPTPEPAPAVAPVVESCNLNWIFFDFDKSNLRSASQTELDDMAAILKKNPDYEAVLRAHTDFKGSDAYNEALSDRRATNAKQYLISKGIAASRIKTSLSGEKDPIAKNEEDDRGRQYNRRVELFVQDKNGKNVCESIPPAISSDLKAN